MSYWLVVSFICDYLLNGINIDFRCNKGHGAHSFTHRWVTFVQHQFLKDVKLLALWLTETVIYIIKKKCIDFRYVGRATADVDEDGDTLMNGYRSVDESKTLFKISETDIFAVPLTDIICQLRNPVDEILSNGRKAHVRFSGSIDMKEC